MPDFTNDMQLVEALRAGDEAAFSYLLDHYHNALIRTALLYVSSRAVAEEVAQETWLGVLQGIQRFEGRSSLKTWLFRILMNRAQTRGQREHRSIPFSNFAFADTGAEDPAVEPERFLPASHARWPGHWMQPPRAWDEIPEERFLSQELRAVLLQAIDNLPPQQRQVISLRDIEGWSADEVCNALNLSETNQRVLLHRARSKARHALEQYLGGTRGDRS